MKVLCRGKNGLDRLDQISRGNRFRKIHYFGEFLLLKHFLGIAAEKDYLQPRLDGSKGFIHLFAVHARHDDIEQNEPDGSTVFPMNFQRLRAVGGG